MTTARIAIVAAVAAAALSWAPAASGSPETCRAGTFDEIEACLALPAATDPSVLLEIVITNDITLGDREHLRIADKHGVVVRGEYGTPVTIDETRARLEGSGGNNRYLISIVGGSNVTLADLRIRDAPGAGLAVRCRAGSDPARPLRWEKGPCDPPVIVGDGAAAVTLERVDVTSGKPILLEVREVRGLTIRRSAFRDGAVFGVFLHDDFSHSDVVIASSEFAGMGANAIVVQNAAGVVIRTTTFLDNHDDMQFEICGPDRDGPCSGGQLLVRDHRGRGVRDVVIVGNTILQTDPDRPTATGIEIGNADRAPLEGIVVMGNRISGHGRQAIQVHFGNRPGGHEVVISGNYLVGNATALAPGFDDQINLNGNSGITVLRNLVVGDAGGPMPVNSPHHVAD